jgi:hypothetical protein
MTTTCDEIDLTQELTEDVLLMILSKHSNPQDVEMLSRTSKPLREMIYRNREYLKGVIQLCETCSEPGDAVTAGHLHCLQFLYGVKKFPVRSHVTDIAADVNRLDILQYLFKFGNRSLPSKNAVHRAVINGNVQCLKLLLEHACPIPEGVTYDATRAGHWECLKLLVAHGYEWNDKCDCLVVAAKRGNLEMVKFIHENGCKWWGQSSVTGESVSEAAASNGHVDCLIYAIENGCRHTYNAIAKAARNGHLNCIIAAHERNVSPSQEVCTDIAAFRGHMDCLKFLHENGYPSNSKTLEYAAESKSIEVVKYVHSVIGIPWNPKVSYTAVSDGWIECVEYFHREHMDLSDVKMSIIAARNDQREMLKFLLQLGYPKTVEVTRDALAYGGLECLKVAHELGCPWDESVTNLALARYQNRCYQYAVRNGCPFNRKIGKHARLITYSEDDDEQPLSRPWKQVRSQLR